MQTLTMRLGAAIALGGLLLATAGTASGARPTPGPCDKEFGGCYEDCATTKTHCSSSCGTPAKNQAPSAAHEKCVAACETGFAVCARKCLSKKKTCEKH